MVQSNILSLSSMVSPANGLQAGKSSTYVGIDFGTSTTVVSVATLEGDDTVIKTLPIRLKQKLEDGSTECYSEKLPSVIAWYNGRLLVGEGASNLKYILTKGKNIWYSFKMEIGEDLGAKYYNSEISGMDGINIRNPKDCVRVFFKYLKILIERYCVDNGLPTNIKYAVSIPASFEANQRKDLIEALEYNEMSVTKQSLIDEPNAAFISYIHDSESSETPLLISPHVNSNVLVFDFGGGTCDISILEIGKSTNGLYSKNVAISKFTKLGGDDIDRYFTFKYLLPRFFEHNKIKQGEFRTKEIQYIATQLYKVAERLKILVSKKISLLTYDFAIPPSIHKSSIRESINIDVSVGTKKGILSQNEFYLTYEEFSEAMSVFTKESLFALKRQGEDDFNNIFIPIKSALKKANLKKTDIDYVLFIGGSAQNPFIQAALKNYFDESDILVPQDLQTHVAKGASIHSLLMNGMNKCIIQPITSEPIFVITKDLTNKILIPAGTTIPCNTVVVDDLVPTRDNQESIELPICVGNANKMLFNLKITRDGGFSTASQVKLVLEITADKLLLAQATCMGTTCMVEPQNPFANKELSTEEKIVLQAERLANIESEKNGGVPTKNSLVVLRQAYEDAENYFKAAETLEQQNEIYPDPNDYNLIGVYYHNSGVKDKAVDFFEKAIEFDGKSYWPYFNIGNTLLYKDSVRARKYLEKAYEIRPNEPCVNIALARLDEVDGKIADAKAKYRVAYDVYEKKRIAGTLRKVDYGWFAAAAEGLGKKDKALEIKSAKPKIEQTMYYDENNLTKTKSKAIQKINF